MKTMNVALMGAGRIAGIMANVLHGMEGAAPYAVASRDKAKADAFAAEFGIPTAYGSYEEMLADPKVDLVYVATPHSHHAQHAMQCINAGKPVLCEKAFTGNARQAREVLALAKEKGVFITEAMWTRYMPLAKKLQQLMESGAIGRPTMVVANLGFKVAGKARLVEPALAGGALLDLGIYPLTFASIAFGDEVERYTGIAQLMETGVDAQESITLQYPGGRMAVLYSSQYSHTDNRGIVYGTEGRIEVYGCNDFYKLLVVDTAGNVVETHHRDEGCTGYEYEVLACKKALEAGTLECPEMPHSQTLAMMELMDGLRAQFGVEYPFD